MPNTQLTHEKIQKRIQQRLGGNAVEVELDEGDFMESIERAVDFYNHTLPRYKFVRLDITLAQKRYLLTEADHPGLAGVLEVEFITRRAQPSAVDPFDPFDTALAGIALGSGSGETYGEIQQRLQYSEEAARIVDSEPDWEAIEEDDGIALYIDKGRDHVIASAQLVLYYDSDDAGLAKIPRGDVHWFLDYATAACEEILGRKRGKFQGIPNPDGGTDPTDSDDLIQHGRQRMTELEEELRTQRVPLPPVIE